MTNVTVQEALKSAIEAFELHAKQYQHMVKGYCIDALEDCKSALADIEKCEPVYMVNELDLGWEEVNRIYYDAVIGCPKRNLYTSPISKEREGWVSVPIELNRKQKQAMIWAYEEAMGGARLPDGDAYDETIVQKMHEAMLSAAPKE